MLAIVFAIAFFASTIGAICGIGGGIIIKPAMDAVGAADVATINFLSGCTVLSMTCYSVIKSKVSGDSKIDPKIDTPLAVGAAAGGLAGRQMFSAVASFFGDANIAGAVQAGTLMLVTVGTLLYTLNKEKIATRNVTGVIPCMAIGLVLGISSSFLGIGGGPINLVVLFYFFTMSTKRAAQSSLYIILFSQAASTIAAIAGGVSNLDVALLAGMAACGILGGIAGRAMNKHIDDARWTNCSAAHGCHHFDQRFQRGAILRLISGPTDNQIAEQICAHMLFMCAYLYITVHH